MTLGKTDDTYGWDNEYGRLDCDIKAFKASKMLVSNAEFYEFVQAGGYQDPQWWDEEGQGWLSFSKAEMPTFWVGAASKPAILKLRLLAEEVPMPWDWPVEVNQLEAAAFCRWKAEDTGKSIQLPTEAEWYVLRQQVEGDQPGWDQAPGNINLAWWASSCPVDRFPQGDFYDIVGNVWQWTTTPISGFDGFKVHPLYDDFSTPTFDGKHAIIKGGSWISTGNEALKYSRYAFRRHFFQLAGFRYVVSTHQEKLTVNPYETDLLVSQYLDFQYGPRYFNVPNYARALVDIAEQVVEKRGSALDIGCATGRASFELARTFDQVTGMDYSARFIDVALSLVRGEERRYLMPEEGELVQYCQASLSEIGITPEQAERVQFVQGDACNLKPHSESNDLVLAMGTLNIESKLPVINGMGLMYGWMDRNKMIEEILNIEIKN